MRVLHNQQVPTRTCKDPHERVIVCWAIIPCIFVIAVHKSLDKEKSVVLCVFEFIRRCLSFCLFVLVFGRSVF